MLALNVTEVPAHTGLAEGATEMLTGSSGLTIIITGLEVAGFPVAQVAFDVTTQVITLLFTGIFVKVEFVAPVTFVPFTFH